MGRCCSLGPEDSTLGRARHVGSRWSWEVRVWGKIRAESWPILWGLQWCSVRMRQESARGKLALWSSNQSKHGQTHLRTAFQLPSSLQEASAEISIITDSIKQQRFSSDSLPFRFAAFSSTLNSAKSANRPKKHWKLSRLIVGHQRQSHSWHAYESLRVQDFGAKIRKERQLSLPKAVSS